MLGAEELVGVPALINRLRIHMVVFPPEVKDFLDSTPRYQSTGGFIAAGLPLLGW